MEPCVDKAVERLVEALREVPVAKRFEAIGKAINQLLAEEAKEGLFDSQIKTLRDRGCPEEIVLMFQTKRELVLKEANKKTTTQGNLPFLFVIPETRLSIYAQIPMTRNGDNAGYDYSSYRARVVDVLDKSAKLYCIFDVNDGEATLSKSHKDAQKAIHDQSRFILNEVEAIALCVHTDVLSRHNVEYMDNPDRYEHLWLGSRTPMFHWDYIFEGFKNGGMASCGSRLEL